MENGSETVEVPQEFNFEELAEKMELSRKTIKYLRGEELMTIRTISLIEDKDIVMMPLPLGQRKLLQMAAQQMKVTTTDPLAAQHHAATLPEKNVVPPTTAGDELISSVNIVTTPTDATFVVNLDTLRKAPDVLNDTGKTYDELFPQIQLDPLHTDEVSSPSNNYQFDPRAILTIKAKVKVTHITDFLSEKTKKRRQSRKKELILSTGGGNQDRLVLKPDEDHPYSGITIDEWGAANCRVMHALLVKGTLRRDHVEYYLAYTAKIFEFAASYDWETVLDYDHQYRNIQAEHLFLWGVTPPDMELRILSRQNSWKYPGPRRSRGYEATYNGRGKDSVITTAQPTSKIVSYLR